MQDRQLYQQILGISEPWNVADVELNLAGGEVVVRLEHHKDARWSCAECGTECAIHDHTAERRWRHLDTCQYRTVIRASLPRTRCPEHGVHQVRASWAEPHSRFTALFERLIIDWLLKAGSQTAVRKQLGLTWDEVHSVMERAVRRGLGRSRSDSIRHLGVDEKSYRKGQKYVTVVTSAEPGDARVLYVGEGRKEESLDGFWRTLTPAQLGSIEAVAMDMWEAYENSVRRHVPDAAAKIVYDKFHIVSHLGDAIDEVRREENRQLRASGNEMLKGSRYSWLRNPKQMTAEERRGFWELKASTLRTAKAWAMKQAVMPLWEYRYQLSARKLFWRWYRWVIRTRLEPMKRVARMLARRLDNIVTYVTHPITNAVSESMNSRIQWVRYTARGHRNLRNFMTAIYFFCGGLDLAP